MVDEVVFDTSFLLPIFSQDLRIAPKDPTTGKPVEKYYERIDYHFTQLVSSGTKILIPAPALSEILVKAGQAGKNYLKRIESASAFFIVPFETHAAIEVAEMSRRATERGDKREGSAEPWQKIKIDRQIIAIAKASGAEIIYSDDRSLRKFAEQDGLKTVSSDELPLPREPKLL